MRIKVIFPGDGRTEEHWIKDNIISRIQPLTVADLEMLVNIQRVDEVGKDFSCDSNLMLVIMDKIGNVINRTYHIIIMVD